jgi:hypothetical protein
MLSERGQEVACKKMINMHGPKPKKNKSFITVENLEQNTPKTPAPWEALPLKKSKSGPTVMY